MYTVVVLAIVVAFLSIPTMVAAKVVGTENTGFGYCLGATVLAVAASYSVESVMPHSLVGSIIELLVCTLIFKLALRTSMVRAAGVGLLVLVLQAMAIVGLTLVGVQLRDA